MVYRRRKYRRPYKSNRRRKYSRWVKRKQQRAAKLGNKKYFFVRYEDRPTVTTDPINFIAGGHNFRLTDLPDYQEFVPLYDQYKISAVKVKWIPLQVTTQGPGATAPIVSETPFIYAAIDYTDSNAPTSVDSIRQYQSMRYSSGSSFRPLTLYFKPRFQTEIYQTAATSGYAPKRGWISITDSNVPHYGCKYIITPTGLGSPVASYKWKVEMKYYLAFRSVR